MKIRKIFFAFFLVVLASGTFAYPKKKVRKSTFCKPSKVNGQPRMKAISGYQKRTKNGCIYVKPYHRSR